MVGKVWMTKSLQWEPASFPSDGERGFAAIWQVRHPCAQQQLHKMFSGGFSCCKDPINQRQFPSQIPGGVWWLHFGNQGEEEGSAQTVCVKLKLLHAANLGWPLQAPHSDLLQGRGESPTYKGVPGGYPFSKQKSNHITES